MLSKPNTEKASPSTVQGGKAYAEPRRILLVDDEPAIRELGERVLEREGFKVATAESGERALEIFRERKNKFSIIVMDLSMPGMGGLACLKQILAIDPTAKVIIASGRTSDESVEQVIREGAAGYVAKPFSRAELLGKLYEMLADEQESS